MNTLEKLLAGGIRLPFCFIEGDGVGAGAGAGDTSGGAGAGAGTGSGAGAGSGGTGGGETGAAPAVTTPEVNPADNPREFLRDAVSKVKIDAETGQRVEDKTQAPEEKAAADALAKAEADKAAAAKTGEGQPQPKTEEEQEAEKAAADQKAKEAEAAKTQAEANPLDKGGPVPAEKLAEALKTNPELGAALEKAGIDKEQLFETSRRAALSEQFLEHFPTPEAAKFGRESAEHFYDIEESFPKIQTTEDLDKFITGTMLPLSLVYGPDGKPVMNPDGKSFKTDGSVSRFMGLVEDFGHNVSKGLAESIIQQGIRAGGEQGDQIKEYGERLKSALDVIGEFRAAGYKMPTPKGQAAELSPEQKAEFDRLKKLEQETTAGKSKEQEAQTTAFEENLFKDATEDSDKFLRATIDATSLTENEKKHAIADIYEEVGKKMGADRTFQQLKQQLWAQGLNDKTRAEIRALNKRTFTVYAAKVMDKVLSEAGAKRIQANADRQAKIDAQIDKDKMHQTTGTSTGSTTARMPSGDDLYNKAVTELTKELGRAPKEGELFSRLLKLKGLAQTA